MPGAPRAILLDALGTLVELEPPAPLLVDSLAARGIAVPLDAAERAVIAEMTYYRANLHLGGDRDSLAVLRGRCAQEMAAQLPGEVRSLEEDEVTEVMLESLSFAAYPDAVPALEALRALGLRLVVVSNWDCSLPDALESAGLAGHVDGAVASAELGSAKPDPAPFEAALAIAGVSASEAWHVGDQVEVDVVGARNAGIEPVLVDRWGARPEGVRAIDALTELPALLA